MINLSGGGETRRLVHERTRGARRAAASLLTVLSLVLGVLASVVVAATPASAIPAAVSTTRTVSGFPRFFADQDGTRAEPCIDPTDPFCVLVPNPPVFDPAAGPVVFPTNFPDEFFYYIADSDVITTPGCGAVSPPGKALVRVALEGTFANGVPVPGEQMVFGRVRVTVSSGLCPNTPYTFTHPWGSVTLTTEPDGSLRRNQATTDIGCAPAANTACDFTQALPSTVMSRFIKWDPAVAPAAPAGYLGDPNVLHQITGSPTGTNFFRISGAGTPVQQTNLFAVSGKIAGPLNAAPETLDGGNQPINIASGPRTITLTNVSPAAMTIGAISVSPAGSAWSITGNTCGAVARDASCTVTLVFAPTVVGPANATLVVNHNSFRTPTTIPLVGNGTAAVAPSVTIAPSAVDFGRTLLTTAAGPFGVVVRNNGPGTFVPTGTTVVDSAAGTVGDSAAFLPIASTDCPAAGLVAGTSCTVSVRFTPTQQRPYTATLQVNGTVGATAVPLTATLTGRGGIAVSSTGLDGLGPDGLAIGSFPTWYQDDRGVRLAQCLNAADPNCIVLPDATFNPALPLAFPTNFPGEAFYYITDSELLTTPGCGAGSPPGKAAFRAATEATFVNGNPVAGEQVVFDRVRVFATSGLCPGQTYTFVHPYGEFTFVADELGGLKRSPGTIDIGCTPAPGTPCNFNNATLSPVSDGYLRYDTSLPAPPAGYLGDAATLHTVAGAPYIEPGQSTAANYVKLLDSAGNVVAQTNLFTIMGKIDPTQPATRYQTVAPKAVAFANQATATTSAARTITVESVGTTPMTVTGVTVSGANAADFTVATNTCGVQAVGSRCAITVTFRPGAAGLRTATLSIASDVANTWTGSVPLSGTGVGVAPPAPVLTAAPTSLTFTNQLVATTSAPQAVTVTNTGTANLTVSAATLGGANAGDFALVNGCAAAVVPGGTCSLAITFRPTAAGARAGSLAITSDGGNATITLAGTGTAPVQTVTPTALTFAGQTVATTSAAQNVTVTNTGTAPLTVQTVALAGVDAASFASVNNCTTLVTGASCSIAVSFTPATVGAKSATLTIASNAGTTNVAITGTGLAAPVAVLSAAPAALTFASQTVGTTSAVQNITVTNTGTASLTVSGVTVGGVNAADFAATNGCTVAVAPAGTCTIGVRFTPTAAGARAGSVSIASNGGTSTVSLSGTGAAATVVFTLLPSTLTFTATNVGATTSAASFLTVTGQTAPVLPALTITGPDAAMFRASACFGPVSSGGVCPLSVTFAPTSGGTKTATLTISAPGGALNVPLTATAIGAVPAPVLSAAPTALTFASQTVGTTSAAQNITVTNTGTASLTVSGVTVGGVNAADFAATNGCALAVAPAATCTIGVRFTPAAAGTRTGSVTVTSNGGTSTVALTGTAVAPAVFTATNGARSVFTIATYSATVSATTYTGNALVVTFSATGPLDLVRPEGTCITITQPNGTTLVRRPVSVSLTSNVAGNFAGTMTFSGLAVGTVDLQYGCFAGYSQARIGTLATPPAGTYWNANGEQSIYSPNTVYRATFTSSSVAGGNLTVAFSATGLVDLVRPEGTCLVITAANGTTRTLAPTTALTTNLAGNYAGTFTFTGVTAGTFQLQYGCFAGYTQARIGFLA